MSKPTQITVRIPEDWAQRLDKIAEALSQPGTPGSRSMAIRRVFAAGLDTTEAAIGIKATTSKKTAK